MHHVVAIEAHRSNGRVERVIRTIRDSLLKVEGEISEENLSRVIEGYNNSYHKSIKMTPKEAIMDENNADLILANSKYDYKGKKYEKGNNEKYEIGERIIIAKKENIKEDTKEKAGRFLDKGIIVGVFENDSYLVRKNDGKIVKKRYYDIKKDLSVEVDETAV